MQQKSLYEENNSTWPCEVLAPATGPESSPSSLGADSGQGHLIRGSMRAGLAEEHISLQVWGLRCSEVSVQLRCSEAGNAGFQLSARTLRVLLQMFEGVMRNETRTGLAHTQEALKNTIGHSNMSSGNSVCRNAGCHQTLSGFKVPRPFSFLPKCIYLAREWLIRSRGSNLLNYVEQ